MRHLRVLGQIPGIRPVAVPRRSERARELVAAGLTVARDIRQAAETGAKFCIVATDTGRHVEDGLTAINHGLDVLVEKPLSTDALEAKQFCEKAADIGRKIYVGCVLRFSESLNIFRNLLGLIGRVHSVRIECQSYLPEWRPDRLYRESYSARAHEGGVLWDLIHEIDYAGWLFGWPVAIEARVRNLGRLGIEADEAADLMWETAGGTVVSVSLDYLTRPTRRKMTASGEFGTISWDGIQGTVTVSLAGENEKIFPSTQTRDEMILAQDLAFIDSPRANRSDGGLATGDEGVKALAICDAARRAGVSQRQEKVEYQ